jgi:hypothetical protein
VSGYAEGEMLSALAENEHFLAKPFLPADLFRLVREILESRGSEQVERVG